MLTISNYFYSQCFLRFFPLLSIILRHCNDVKIILLSFSLSGIGWHGRHSSTRSVGGTSATQTPYEMHSILRINPCNWTFPNCNISFILDQSIKKTTNESNCYKQHMGKPVLLWEPCYSLGNKPIVWVVRKVRTDVCGFAQICWQILFVLKFSVCHDLPT